MSGADQTTTRYWEGPLPILQWGQATLPKVPWPQVAARPAAAPSRVRVADPAAMRTTIGTLIGRIPKAANGDTTKRRELLSVAVEAGRLLNHEEVAAAANRIVDLRRMLDVAEANAGPPPIEVPRPMPQPVPSPSASAVPAVSRSVPPPARPLPPKPKVILPPQMARAKPPPGANRNAPSPPAPPSAPNLSNDPPRKPGAPAVAANATPAISQQQPVGAQNNPALSARPLPDGEEVREFDVRRGAPDSNLWEPVALPTRSPNIFFFRRKAGAASGARSNAGPPVGQPSLAAAASNPAPIAPAASPSNAAAPQPPPQAPPGDVVDAEKEAWRAKLKARNKQQYEETRAINDPELKSVPFAGEFSRIGDTVLGAWERIIAQDSKFLDQLRRRITEIGAAPVESMGNWKGIVAVEGLQKNLLGALQKLTKLNLEVKAFQGEQDKAAKKGDESWERYRLAVKAYGGNLEDAGYDQHPRWTDYEKARDAREKKGQTYRDRREKHRDLMISINQAIDMATKHISAMQQVLADPDMENIKDKFSLGTAVELKHRGIRFMDVELGTYNDGNLDPCSQDAIGKGACSTVDKVVYKSDGKDRYFKPEMLADKPYCDGANSEYDPVAALGIDRKAPRYANRNIASNVMARALGLEVMPEVLVVAHNKQFGLLMDAADGDSPKYADGRPKQPWGILSAPQVASLHSGLNGLEWCDVLTGQADRHALNYHVKADDQTSTVKVTGIDNDRAFGAKQDHVMKTYEVSGFQSVGLPCLIDEQVYRTIIDPKFRKNTMQGLQGLLSDDEIKATEKRIDAVIAAAKNLSPNFVVHDWATWTSPDDLRLTATEYLAAQNGGSLFQRDFAEFFPNKGKRPDPPKDGAKK